MAKLIRADGTWSDVTLVSNDRGLLTQLQTLVGGYIEVITLGGTEDRREVLVMNEDGKREQLPVNSYATILARLWLRPDDCIVGPVVSAVIEHGGEDDERWI